MAPSQLENIIDEVLKSGSSRPLDVFLERDADSGTTLKCSQKFLTKLDKLITKSLDEEDARTASLSLASIYKCGKNLKLPGGQGLPGLISQGLVKKISWFEKCQQLWIQLGPHWDETMFTLSENFLNALMVVHESCKEGTCKVTESFLYPVGQLAVNPRIYILIQKEAIRKYNAILDKIPVDFKKNRMILKSQETSDVMTKLAAQILEGGDYDLQSSLIEALCRMATSEQRKKLANQWFSMAHVASAFAEIIDSEFETACRRFLNMVNGIQGDRRRVYSYPCLEVYLGKYELLMPSDEKLDRFWIDFNLGSRSISFYFSLLDEEESHWETICINENEVQSYTVTEKGKRQVLQIKLSEVVIIGAVEGSILTIHFSSSLDILQAAQNVYGHIRYMCTPVVKTAGKPVMEGNRTQVVPESQVPLGESEKKTSSYILSASAAPAQMVTPAKIRISESTAYISSSERGTVHSISSLCLMPSTKDKDRSFMEKKIPVAEAKQEGVTGQEEDKSQENYFVPDTQPRSRTSISSSWNKLSVSEMLMMPTQKIGSLPISEPNSSGLGQLERCPSSGQKWSISESNFVLQKQLHGELTQRLQKVLNERKKDSQCQEEVALETTMSGSRGNSKDRSSGNVCGSSLCMPKVQHVQRKNHAKEEREDQMMLEADTVPKETAVKTSAAKQKQNKKESKAEDETKMAYSDKKNKDEVVAANMMKLISSRYKMNTRSTAKDTAENIVPHWNPPLLNRTIFSMNMYSAKKEVPKAVNQKKSLNKTTTSVKQRKDIFAFTTDSPFHIGGENKTFDTSNSGIHSSATHLSTNKKPQPEQVAKNKRYVKKHLFSDTDTDNAPTEVSWLRESARMFKPQVAKYPKQATIKPKAATPQSSFTDKSPDFLPPAQKTTKGSNNNNNNKKPNKAKNPPKTVKKAAVRPHAAGRRPRRAAATSTKSYQEPDTDDSQSETERPSAPKCFSTVNLKNTEKIKDTAQTKIKTATRKQPAKNLQRLKLQLESASEIPPNTKVETGYGGLEENSEKIDSEDLEVKKKKIYQPARSYRRQDSSNWKDLKKQSDTKLQQVRPGNSRQETLKPNKTNVIHAQEQMSALKDSLAACQTSFCPSPPFIEEMRSAERSAPTLDLTCSTVLTPRGSPLPASPKPPCQETPSPIQLLPKLHSTVSSKGKCKPPSFYNVEKNHSSSKTKFIQSIPSPAPSPPAGPSVAEMCAVQQHVSSAPQSPLSLSNQPLMTSTLLMLDKPPVASPLLTPLPEDTISQGCHLNFSKASSVSLTFSSQSSYKSSLLRTFKDSSTAAMIKSSKLEETPVIDRETELPQSLVSGPSRKRHVSSLSNSDEDEREENKKSKISGQHSPRMKPRKLFKSFAEVSTLDELSHISYSNWEAEVDGDMDMNEDLGLSQTGLNTSNICHQWSAQLKNKFKNHCKMMETYNKQSWKTAQQHVSSTSIQLSKFRTQKLKQVQKDLLDEIHNMEQDDDMLKNMEKNLTMHWKKQMTAFHSYQKQEIKRNDTLRRTFKTNACQSLESEEEIVASEMDLVRKEMKSVQERLLTEMLEGEIQSVKRGLHALFFP